MPNLKPLHASAKVILQFERVEEDKEDDDEMTVITALEVIVCTRNTNFE